MAFILTFAIFCGMQAKLNFCSIKGFSFFLSNCLDSYFLSFPVKLFLRHLSCDKEKFILVTRQYLVVKYLSLTVDTSFTFTKKSNAAKCFFDICTAEMAQSLSNLQKSESLKLIILIFYVKKLNN